MISCEKNEASFSEYNLIVVTLAICGILVQYSFDRFMEQQYATDIQNHEIIDDMQQFYYGCGSCI
jgi:hypothetical protein